MSASARTSGAHERTARLLIAYIALLYLGLGAELLESFLNGPVRSGPSGGRIRPLLVVPVALRVAVTLAILWHRPRLLPRGALGVAAVGHLIGWAAGGMLPLVCEALAELWALRRVVDELAAAPADETTSPARRPTR